MPTSAKKRDLPTSPKCDACGRRLVIDPASRGRVARFCSPTCRTAYHRGKRPPAENALSLDDLLDTLAELAEGHERTFSRELDAIRKILRSHFEQR